MPKCACCNSTELKLVTGREIYPHRPDLFSKSFWRCMCGAYVGCHKGTKEPMGTAANEQLRRIRSTIHKLVDPLWLSAENKGKARSKVYAELTRFGLEIGFVDSGCSYHTGCLSWRQASLLLENWELMTPHLTPD